MSRYPFPIPFGWFQVVWGDELPVGEAKAAFYFDRHLVIWRDDSGEAHVQDAFCPHLGAHLGHGGVVEGCEIRCPFHGWKFDAEGTNTDIPYADRTNQKGRINTYPVVERNGVVLAWYHPDEAPTRCGRCRSSPSSTATPTSHRSRSALHHRRGLAGARRERRRLGPLPLRAQHRRGARAREYETEGYRAHMRSIAEVPHAPRRGRGPHRRRHLRARLSPSPASAASSTRTSWAATPRSRPNKCELRFNFRCKTLGDEKITNGVGQAFVNEVDARCSEDKPIWEHKAYLVRPALAAPTAPS